MNHTLLQYLHRTSELHFLLQSKKHVPKKLCLYIVKNVFGCYTKSGLVSFMWKKLEMYAVSLQPKTQELFGVNVKILKIHYKLNHKKKD